MTEEDEVTAQVARRLLGPNAVHLLRLMAAAVDLERFDGRFEPPEDLDSDGMMLRALRVALPGIDSQVEDARAIQSDVATQAVGQIAFAGSSEPGDTGSGLFDREDYRGNGAAAAERAALGLSLRDLLPRELYDALTLDWRRTVGPIHPGDPRP